MTLSEELLKMAADDTRCSLTILALTKLTDEKIALSMQLKQRVFTLILLATELTNLDRARFI